MLKPEEIIKEKYQLKQRLGRTAAGHQTWLAKDLETEDNVTVKLLAFNPQMEWNEFKLFEREAEVLKALNHPKIPKYRDYFEIDKKEGEGVYWFGLVQDYIVGKSLQELLEEGQHFSEEKVRKIAQEILEILIYLHQLNPPVLHRDIKPSNLILGEKDNSIYLIDFGAVQSKAAVTGVTFTIVGTSGYAPLEQFWGKAVSASDLYATGATLIHLLTGIAPANLPQKDSIIQFSNKVNVREDLIYWLEKMTEIAVEKRFQTATIALNALKSGKYHHPSKFPSIIIRNIAKPDGSLIKLTQKDDQLKIQIPAPGLRQLRSIGNIWLMSILVLLGGLIIISLFFFLTSFIFGFFIAVFIEFSLVSILALSVLLLIFTLLIKNLSKHFGERTLIDFKGNKFQIWRQVLRFTYGEKTGYLDQIMSVFLLQQGKTFQVKMKYNIGKTYNLGGALGEEESIWLMQEINNWIAKENQNY